MKRPLRTFPTAEFLPLWFTQRSSILKRSQQLPPSPSMTLNPTNSTDSRFRLQGIESKAIRIDIVTDRFCAYTWQYLFSHVWIAIRKLMASFSEVHFFTLCKGYYKDLHLNYLYYKLDKDCIRNFQKFLDLILCERNFKTTVRKILPTDTLFCINFRT